MTKSKTYTTWGDIEMLVHDLCTQIAMSGLQIEHIFGLPRGGLIPAVMISHKLGIPMAQYPNLPNTLIVDDICDSGETFRELFKIYPKSKFACLHFKPHTSNFTPDLAASTFPFDDWISYPWERKDEDPIADYLKKV